MSRILLRRDGHIKARRGKTSRGRTHRWECAYLENSHPTLVPKQENKTLYWFYMFDQRLTGTKQWLRERRSQRIELTVPVFVHRPPKEAPQFDERAQTLVVSAHGALMALTDKVAPGQTLLVQNIDSGEQQECHVVYIEKGPTGPTKVALEFTRPAPSFWRIAYPPADWTASARKV
jgi:hypothetical protein